MERLTSPARWAMPPARSSRKSGMCACRNCWTSSWLPVRIPPARPTGFHFNRRFPDAEIALDLPDILFAQPGQRRMLPGDIANLHALIGILAVRTIGNGYIIPAVQFLTDYSGAERISFQANHQIQGGGAVAHLDDAAVSVRTDWFSCPLRHRDGRCFRQAHTPSNTPPASVPRRLPSICAWYCPWL